MSPRRFPSLWSVDEEEACVTVLDATGPLRLFRGRAGTARGRPGADPRRGPAHRRQRGQADRVLLRPPPPMKRGVTTLQRHIHDGPRHVRLHPNAGSIAATHYLTSWATLQTLPVVTRSPHRRRLVCKSFDNIFKYPLQQQRLSAWDPHCHSLLHLAK